MFFDQTSYRLLVARSPQWSNIYQIRRSLEYFRQLPDALGKEFVVVLIGKGAVNRFVADVAVSMGMTVERHPEHTAPEEIIAAGLNACVGLALCCSRVSCREYEPHYSHGCGRTMDAAIRFSVPTLIVDCYGEWAYAVKEPQMVIVDVGEQGGDFSVTLEE